MKLKRTVSMVAGRSRSLEDLPLDVALRCVAVLPISDAPQFRRVCRKLRVLCGPEFSRTRARLGIRELRLVGAVASDPRKKRGRALCEEAARVTMELQPDATSAAKDLLRIEGSELEAVIQDVDRAASFLESSVLAERPDVEMSNCNQDDAARSTLHDWDSCGSMREVEVYAVVDGHLFLIGPAELRHLRWMMHMADQEEQFGSLQNARLYIAGVNAEIQTNIGTQDSEATRVLQRSNDQTFMVPEVMNSTASKSSMLDQGIRGQLLLCALEL